MLRYAEVSIGGSLVSCRRCGRAEDARALSADEVAAAAKAASESCGGAVALVGGDLFEREDASAVLGAALVPSVTRLRVDAGAALLEADAARLSVERGLRHVRIGLLEPGEPGGVLQAARVFAGAAASAGAAAVVTALVPVCRHNLHQLPAAVTALAEAGVAEVTLRVADATLPAAPAAPWLVAAADTGTVNRVWVRIEGFDANAMPGYGLHFTQPFVLGGTV